MTPSSVAIEISAGAEPFPAGTPWVGEARALLERAIRCHGGWARWSEAGGIAMRLVALGGLLPAAKGLGRTFPRPARIEVWPRQRITVFGDYPDAGARGVFSAGRVRLVDARGHVVAESAAPRATFTALRKYRRWSPLDALYFFGYAVAHYHGLPFTLVDGRPLGMERASLGGRRLQGVRVELPADLHTHCRTQTFLFDEDGLLRRHDYVAEIVGSWARGAHLWEDFTSAGGLPVARRRRVLARLGRHPVPLVALSAELEAVSATAAAAHLTVSPPEADCGP